MPTILSRGTPRHQRALIAMSVVVALASSASGQKAAVGQVVTEFDKAVMHVYHAKNGDYWFGSKERGAYRYDGKTLVNFTTKDGLGYNHVGGIQEDKAGATSTSRPRPTSTPTAANSRRPSANMMARRFSPCPSPRKRPPIPPGNCNPTTCGFGAGQDTGAVYRYDGTTMHRLELPRTKDGDDFIAAHPRSKYPNIKHSPYDTYINFKDGKGHMWFGTALLGVVRYDGSPSPGSPKVSCATGRSGRGRSSRTRTASSGSAIHCTATRSI